MPKVIASAASRADDIIESSRLSARAGSRASKALQALQKKIDRGSTLFGTEKTQEAAERLIRQIVENATSVSQSGRTTVYRDAFGRGVKVKDGVFDAFFDGLDR